MNEDTKRYKEGKSSKKVFKIKNMTREKEKEIKTERGIQRERERERDREGERIIEKKEKKKLNIPSGPKISL